MAEDGESDGEDGELVQNEEGNMQTDDSLGRDARGGERVSKDGGDGKEGRGRRRAHVDRSLSDHLCQLRVLLDDLSDPKQSTRCTRKIRGQSQL